jgi:hypothetical protein
MCSCGAALASQLQDSSQWPRFAHCRVGTSPLFKQVLDPVDGVSFASSPGRVLGRESTHIKFRLKGVGVDRVPASVKVTAIWLNHASWR